MAVQGISWSGIFVRVAAAVALVLLTYNPSGHSFYHWIAEAPGGITAVKGFLGVLLLIGWVICLRTAYVSLGWLGVVLGVSLLGTFVWVLFDVGLLESHGAAAFVWIGLIIFGAVLGIGLSWSLIRARTTGQVEVD